MLTAACSSASVVVAERRTATCPAMNIPRSTCPCSSTSASVSPTRSRPLLAIRSRPTFRCSSCSQTSRSGAPSALSRSLVRSNSAVKGLGTHRVAWPGAVCSSSVPRAASTCRWNCGCTAPCSTASSVNRYAVPISTPAATPSPASGAARAATIAAERSSCTPPANRTSTGCEVFVSLRWSSNTANCASQSGKLCRGPTWPPHSEPSNTNLRAPSSRNCFSSPGEGTCRKVRMPASSSTRACDGRPPAITAWVGRAASTSASWALRTSSGANPNTPTPQGSSPTVPAVRPSSSRVCSYTHRV